MVCWPHASLKREQTMRLSKRRERRLTPTGRAYLRERMHVEHTLAHIGHW
jgi:hypothetical protein